MSNAEAIERLRRMENGSYSRQKMAQARGSHNVSREHAKDAEALRLAVSVLERKKP